MTRYVVANWKSHKTIAEAKIWLNAFSGLYLPDPSVEVILAPSFVHLPTLAQLLQVQGCGQQLGFFRARSAAGYLGRVWNSERWSR